MGFNKTRLELVMQANGIYENDIYKHTGYNIKWNKAPSKEQMSRIIAYFSESYPTVNVYYITEDSESINKFIDTSDLKDVMKEKNISVGTLNNFVQDTFKVEKGFYKILNGLWPKSQADANKVLEFVGEAPVETTLDVIVKEAKQPKEQKSKKTIVNRWDGNHIDNKLNMDIIEALYKEQGYKKTGLADMAMPSRSGHTTLNLLLNKEKKSPGQISQHYIDGLCAALNCDLKYLEGAQKERKKNKAQVYRFPADPDKKFMFKKTFIWETDKALLKVMAQNAGISFTIMERIKNGEEIYFTDTCIRRMFNKYLVNLLKNVNDINDVLISTDGSKVSNYQIIDTKEEKKKEVKPEPVKKVEEKKPEPKQEEKPVEKKPETVKKVEDKPVEKKPDPQDQKINKFVRELNQLESEKRREHEENNDIIVEMASKPYGDRDKIAKKEELLKKKAEEKKEAETQRLADAEKKPEFKNIVINNHKLKYSCACGNTAGDVQNLLKKICPICKTAVVSTAKSYDPKAVYGVGQQEAKKPAFKYSCRCGLMKSNNPSTIGTPCSVCGTKTAEVATWVTYNLEETKKEVVPTPKVEEPNKKVNVSGGMHDMGPWAEKPATKEITLTDVMTYISNKCNKEQLELIIKLCNNQIEWLNIIADLRSAESNVDNVSR